MRWGYGLKMEVPICKRGLIAEHYMRDSPQIKSTIGREHYLGVGYESKKYGFMYSRFVNYNTPICIGAPFSHKNCMYSVCFECEN